MSRVKRTFQLGIKNLNGRIITEFNNLGISTLTVWRKPHSIKKNLLLSATVGSYLYGDDSLVLNKLKKNTESLIEKLKNKGEYPLVEKELEFLRVFIKDLENIKETTFS